jgi:hypothetical protein
MNNKMLNLLHKHFYNLHLLLKCWMNRNKVYGNYGVEPSCTRWSKVGVWRDLMRIYAIMREKEAEIFLISAVFNWTQWHGRDPSFNCMRAKLCMSRRIEWIIKKKKEDEKNLVKGTLCTNWGCKCFLWHKSAFEVIFADVLRFFLRSSINERVMERDSKFD